MITKPSKIRPLFMQCSIYFFILHLLLQFSPDWYLRYSTGTVQTGGRRGGNRGHTERPCEIKPGPLSDTWCHLSLEPSSNAEFS